jgi:hypothetical protein
VEEQVAMFLHIVGHNQMFRVVHQSFARSIETVHRNFHQVLYVVGELRNEMIKPPSAAIPIKILGSSRWNPYLKVIVICTGRTVGVYCSNHIGLYLLITLATIYRTVLEPFMAHMSWLGYLDAINRPSGVGGKTPHKMSWLLSILISSSLMSWLVGRAQRMMPIS